MGGLNFIPQLTGVFFDNVWYSLIYLLLTVTSIATPVLNEKTPRLIMVVFSLFTGWYFSAFTFHIIAFFEKSILDDVNQPSLVFVRYTLIFVTIISIIIFQESWRKKIT
jgi:NADH:ubiquinone oxidoreductase subunit 6 (subunit J)